MDQYSWIIWLIVGVCLLVAEAFTLSFFLFWFGLGAIAAAAVAMFGLGIGWQFAVFVLISVAFTVMSRTIFASYLSHRDEDTLKMGMDSLPGQIGTVTIASKGALSEGAVKVYGSEWTAYPVDGESELVEGEKVEVVQVKGSSIFVRRVTKELPGWKQD